MGDTNSEIDYESIQNQLCKQDVISASLRDNTAIADHAYKIALRRSREQGLISDNLQQSAEEQRQKNAGLLLINRIRLSNLNIIKTEIVDTHEKLNSIVQEERQEMDYFTNNTEELSKQFEGLGNEYSRANVQGEINKIRLMQNIKKEEAQRKEQKLFELMNEDRHEDYDFKNVDEVIKTLREKGNKLGSLGDTESRIKEITKNINNLIKKCNIE